MPLLRKQESRLLASPARGEVIQGRRDVWVRAKPPPPARRLLDGRSRQGSGKLLHSANVLPPHKNRGVPYPLAPGWNRSDRAKRIFGTASERRTVS